jgi:hypothetical protein
MRPVCTAASRLFGCLALALLVVNLLAAPPNLGFADSGRASALSDPPVCPSGTKCSTGCVTQACFMLNCNRNSVGCGCANNSYDPDCSKNCACWLPIPSAYDCECGPK